MTGSRPDHTRRVVSGEGLMESVLCKQVMKLVKTGELPCELLVRRRKTNGEQAHDGVYTMNLPQPLPYFIRTSSSRFRSSSSSSSDR